MNAFVQRLTTQFGRPRGLVGQVAGWVMAHRDSNRRRNRWVTSLLDIGPADRVLEIGFGPGIAISELAKRAGHVYGIDHSEVMTRWARKHNAAAVAAGRVELVCASVDRLPDFGKPLDAVMAVNTVGFWPAPVERLREIRTLLRPGGYIALASQPRQPGTSTAAAITHLYDLLATAGFAELRTELLDLTPPAGCVIGVNPSAP
jgi:SAM-dependent methyltransferase